MIQIIGELCEFSPRQLTGEEDAAAYIQEELRNSSIDFIVENYRVKIPEVFDAWLEINGKRYESPRIEGCSKVSGEISGKISFEDSTNPSGSLGMFNGVIACNSHCETASQAQWYPIPALAVDPELFTIAQDAFNASGNISGHVNVDVFDHIGQNILVGNTVDPQKIILTHYDCLKKGAFDNASGVAVLMKSIHKVRDKLNSALFAICGNEEICCEPSIYGGMGYRKMMEYHPNLFEGCEEVFVVDSVGVGESKFLTYEDDCQHSYAGFPVGNEYFEQIQTKLKLLIGDLNYLYSVYHSDNDVPENLCLDELKRTVEMICSSL